MSDNDVKRVPVDYRYDAINPTFLKWMAKIGAYASEKYGAWDQYKKSRLVGEKSPVNHIYEHLRSYVEGEEYDHFDGDYRWHLVAVAYNAMMEFYYATAFGKLVHPLNPVADLGPKRPTSADKLLAWRGSATDLATDICHDLGAEAADKVKRALIEKLDP